MIDRVPESRPNPASHGLARFSLARRGHLRRAAILVVTMWVLIILGALALVFARSMRVEAVASANRLSNVEAASVEHAAEQFVLAQVDGTTGDALSITSTPAQAVQVGGVNGLGGGYFWVLRANPDDYQQYDFGISDEASKINLNSASNTVLVNVPNSTQEIADAIVTWRSSGGTITGQGGGTSYYESLPEPYDNKSGPFETVEELLLVKNTATSGAQTITKDILFGSDLNRDGVVDSGELSSSGGGGTSVAFSDAGGYSDPRGMFNFVTCYTVEPNTDANGTQRINVSDPAQRPQLQKLLASSLSSQRLEQVMSAIAGTGNRRVFNSVIAWYQASGLTPQEFGPIANSLTTNPAKTTTGLVNINTASRQVLMSLGMQQGDADSIVSGRPSNSGGISGAGGSGLTTSSNSSSSTSSDLTWLFQAVSPQSAAKIAPYITTVSHWYSADIVAVSSDGRAFRRARIVVDARTSPALVVYRKDLTGYGWPLPADIRKTMRGGSPPPLIQTSVGTKAGGL